MLSIDDPENAYSSIIWSSEFNGMSIFWSFLHCKNAPLHILVTWGGIKKLSIAENVNASFPIIWSSEFGEISIRWSLEQPSNACGPIILINGGIVVFMTSRRQKTIWS